ncbi:MAG: L-seryl-tRNA(Sec) selenium transferase [Actinomycetia bacterium]|nr:L-seryl-tRNA(Sec) selenium transferase [Actinomycetes bacterium]
MTQPERPPSVDRLARDMAAASDLPHAVCVELAREAIAAGPNGYTAAAANARAQHFRDALLGPVINATGVLLHTNLGRAPFPLATPAQAMNVEFDLTSGERGSRQTAVGGLVAMLCGAEAAMVVNNNAAAVLLVLAALANGRDVLVSRGESVEIGGGFRVPEVMEQSGARLVDVGTTNRTRLADYSKAMTRKAADVAAVLKVHPSNYRIEGFTEQTSVAQLATLGVPVVADIGSGLIDANCPWLPGPPPAWLANEPAARQTLADGAALVTFSGDKLLGGPQAGIIAGRADLVQACKQHPLARALRPGAHVLLALQELALAYLDRTVVEAVPFWQMATTTVNELSVRAHELVAAAGCGEVVATEATPGAGSAPNAGIASVGVRVIGDHLSALRRAQPPIVARNRDSATVLDLRTVNPTDDHHLVEALRKCAS